LMDLYRNTHGPGWYWFEEIVSYNNATLPHALFLFSHWIKEQEMAQVAIESLQWLVDVQTSPKGDFMPIGNKGFFRRGEEKARFDQQPIEAWATVSACLEVYRSTGDVTWYQEAQRAFNWFLGQNDLHLPVYDSDTGGCCDGLHPDRINKNQGAESTLAFLLSLTEMCLLEPSITSVGVAHLYHSLTTTLPVTNQRENRTW